MQQDDVQQAFIDKVTSNPKYQKLVSERTGFGWFMAAIMLVIYYGFILMIAFAPKTLGVPLSAGSVTTIGIPIGIGVIVSAFILTGIYVFRANTYFDKLNEEIKKEVLQ